jgi:hypothetical protein
MAITFNGKLTENENTVAGFTLTILNTGLAISAGDAIIVSVRSGNTAASQITVTDNVNAGNYIKAVEVVDAANGRTVGIYVMPNSAAVAAGSLTVTVTSGASVTLALNGLAYHGVATSSPVDQVNSAAFTTATSTPTSGNITTTASGDLVVGAFGLSTAAIVTVSAENGGFAQEFNDSVGTTGHIHLHTADQILSGTSTLAYAPTLSGTTTGVICVASIMPAAGFAAEDDSYAIPRPQPQDPFVTVW